MVTQTWQVEERNKSRNLKHGRQKVTKEQFQYFFLKTIDKIIVWWVMNK